MGKNHRKINNQFRINYVKNESKKEKEKDDKKLLRKWILPYCKENRDYFRELIDAKDNDPPALPELIKREFMAEHPTIRADRTGFVHNMQYVTAIVDNLESDLPPGWGRDESEDEGDDEWEGGREPVSEDSDQADTGGGEASYQADTGGGEASDQAHTGGGEEEEEDHMKATVRSSSSKREPNNIKEVVPAKKQKLR